MKEDILQLLIQGLSPVEVSRVVTCTEGYISQLMSDEDFRSKVANGRLKNKKKETDHDANILSAEAKALKRVVDLMNYTTKPMEAAKVFQILNNAKLRGNPDEDKDKEMRTVVTINLPPVIRNKLITSATNEVVQIDDRPLVTMNSQLLLKTVLDKTEQLKLENDEAMNKLMEGELSCQT